MVVRMVRPRASEFDAVTKAIFDQPVVDELAAIIHIHRSQGKGQAYADASSVSTTRVSCERLLQAEGIPMAAKSKLREMEMDLVAHSDSTRLASG
ncbi:hypothetical protein X766_34275 [Mesorhizobium sp. LSJC255A00]|nr:hypothetical protein X766_34275 [Mesorhizobium sp. LSJC255A00]